MTIAMRYAARSDVGLVRSNNQDSGYAGPHLLAIADGMGGHAGGDVASSIAIAHLAPLDGESHRADDALALLEDTLDAARDEFTARIEAEPTLAGMGTTVTALLRSGATLSMVHLGDSRGYLLRNRELVQVTTDHTFVQHLVDTGRITPQEAEHHPQRSVVMRVLGNFDIDISPDLSVREARPGDRWLLCSDGLSGFVSAETIAATMVELTDVDACADRLVQLALRAGGPDNITVILADVVEIDDLPDGAAPSTAAQIVGAAAENRAAPSSASDGPAARAAQLVRDAMAAERAEAAAAQQDADGDDGTDADTTPAASTSRALELVLDEDTPGPRRRRWVGLTIAAVVVVVLAAAGWLGYRWTQDQYYVGEDSGVVAVYRGIPQRVGPFELNSVVERTDTEVDTLAGYVRDRLQATIPADSLQDARERAAALADRSDQ